MVGISQGLMDVNLALEMLDFIEIKEVALERGFNRYCDLTRVKAIHLSLEDIEHIAARRRAFNPNMIHVKSAFLATSVLAVGVAARYQALLDSPRIEVAQFRSREDAAKWLNVDARILDR